MRYLRGQMIPMGLYPIPEIVVCFGIWILETAIRLCIDYKYRMVKLRKNLL